MSKTHLAMGANRTWCGIAGGFHSSNRTAWLINDVTCRRCLASLERYKRENKAREDARP